MRDAPAIRLGGIAANLARIASLAGNLAHRQVVLDLIEETKWFIEWTAPSEEPERAERLVELQITLAILENQIKSGKLDTSNTIVAAEQWRDEVLHMSGLLM